MILTSLKSKTLKAFTVALSFALLTSCASNNEATDTADTEEIADTATIENTEEEVERVNYILPSPLQIASIFKKSGLKYIEGVTNKESNLSKYTGKHSKAINMGVYSADLAYCVLNKQTQSALNYIKTVKQLGEDLGMGSAFENSLLQRFEKNMNNEDSLAYIVAELQMQTDIYLEENDQRYLSPLLFAGAWVESMYIAGKVNEKSGSENLANKLSEQMLILNKIIGSLNMSPQQDDASKSLINDLSQIQAQYKTMSEGKEGVENEEPVTLTKQEVATLTKSITELRNKLVNG